MLRVLLLLATAFVSSCGPSPAPTASPAIRPTATAPAEPTGLPTSAAAERQRIEVVNGPREVVVSIATDLAAWAWIVAPGAHLVLLDEPVARPGGIELMDHSAPGSACRLLDTDTFEARSFTIVATGPTSDGAYTMTLDYGSSAQPGSASTEYTSDCSG